MQNLSDYELLITIIMMIIIRLILVRMTVSQLLLEYVTFNYIFLKSICSFMTNTGTAILVSDLILCRIDYCNSLMLAFTFNKSSQL